MNRRRTAIVVSLILAVVVLAVGLSVTGCGDEHAAGGKYHCPMHPTYVADGPGSCPICGMRLVPMDEAPVASGSAPAAASPTAKYYCLMHPTQIAAGPGNCPICEMPMVPMDGAAAGAAAGATAAAPNLPGLATVQATEAGIRLAGVRVAPAARGTITRTTRTVGLVTADERRIRHVHTKIAGWVEKLHVNFIGQAVRAGEPILSLYSPELLASQEELLRAREAAARFAGSSLPEVRRGGEDLVAAARRRLELYDVPPRVIAEVERTGKPQRAITLPAPASGFVTAKDVFEGQQVEPGMELFTLTDLSHVWVEADFYEYEARLLRLGERAEIRLPYEPGHGREAEVTFIYPTLAPDSRTLKVRLELDNRDGDLRPGMYVDVLAALESGEGVIVPDDAVIETGTRQVVFVERESGVFEPREVKVGLRGEGRALVVEGLAEGDSVATRANFLLDSESRLRAALAAIQTTAPAAPPTALPEEAGHVH